MKLFIIIYLLIGVFLTSRVHKSEKEEGRKFPWTHIVMSILLWPVFLIMTLKD